MYLGFNLEVSENQYSEYLKAGKALHDENKKKTEKSLQLFLNNDGDLEASKIITSWFPEIKADIFLSHSHKDHEQVIAMSGWLSERFGLTSFIDSCVWGHSEKLLSIIDNEYCWQKNSDSYDYDKRNRSTAHVYMMLSVAISRMMNDCECIIFVNTPNSIASKDYIDGTKTDSPWIYSEIAMTSVIQKRSPEAHRGIRTLDESLANLTKLAKLNVTYDLDLNHLISLNDKDLLRWEIGCMLGKVRGFKALDALYKIKGTA